MSQNTALAKSIPFPRVRLLWMTLQARAKVVYVYSHMSFFQNIKCSEFLTRFWNILEYSAILMKLIPSHSFMKSDIQPLI